MSEPSTSTASTKSTPERTSDRPEETDAARPLHAARPREATAPAGRSLRGHLAPAPLGRLGRGLVYGTGLFLLRPVAVLLRRLLGWERRAEVSYADGVLVVKRELVVLGTRLGRATEHLPISRVVSASRQEVTAPELLAVGGVFFAIAMVWGILRLVDGLFGRSFGLVAMGLGAVALGAAVDIALTALGGRFPALTSHGIAVHLQDGRSITVRGLPAAGADRLLTSLVCDLRADHPAKE